MTDTLTQAEHERLVLLIEECGEVIQAATKCLRTGYDFKPYNGVVSNKQLLQIEIADVRCILVQMRQRDGILLAGHHHLEEIWQRKLPWTKYQEEGEES